MAGKKRTRYDDESLKELSKKLAIVQEVINDTMAGKSMMESVGEHCVNLHQFRRVLDTVHCMQIHDKICIKSAPERLDKEFMCTPIEALYGGIFGIQGDEWENFSLPKDAMETWLYIKPQLTEREQEVIDHYYFDEMTLEEVGKVYSVTRDRIRQILAKALRKLRHVQRSKILSMGIGEWNRQQAILDEQERIKEEAMAAAFMERLGQQVEEVKNNERLPASSLNADICDLMLSVRSYNCLKRGGYDNIGSVLKCNLHDLQTCRNLGRKSMIEVLKTLYEYFIRLGFPIETIFALRQEMLEEEESDSYIYEQFVRDCLAGRSPWR